MEIILAIGFIIISLIALKCNNSRILRIATCIVYAAAIVYLAFISREPMPIHHYSINPFGAARRGLEFGGGLLSGLLHGTVKITNWAELRNIILNILLFLPFGYLIPSLFPPSSLVACGIGWAGFQPVHRTAAADNETSTFQGCKKHPWTFGVLLK